MKNITVKESKSEKKQSFTFRKKLSNMFNVVKEFIFVKEKPKFYNLYENQILDKKINYNQLYLKTIIYPVDDLINININKLNKCSGRNQ
jgi:hypothetical protein